MQHAAHGVRHATRRQHAVAAAEGGTLSALQWSDTAASSNACPQARTHGSAVLCTMQLLRTFFRLPFAAALAAFLRSSSSLAAALSASCCSRPGQQRCTTLARTCLSVACFFRCVMSSSACCWPRAAAARGRYSTCAQGPGRRLSAMHLAPTNGTYVHASKGVVPQLE